MPADGKAVLLVHWVLMQRAVHDVSGSGLLTSGSSSLDTTVCCLECWFSWDWAAESWSLQGPNKVRMELRRPLTADPESWDSETLGSALIHFAYAAEWNLGFGASNMSQKHSHYLALGSSPKRPFDIPRSTQGKLKDKNPHYPVDRSLDQCLTPEEVHSTALQVARLLPTWEPELGCLHAVAVEGMASGVQLTHIPPQGTSWAEGNVLALPSCY